MEMMLQKRKYRRKVRDDTKKDTVELKGEILLNTIQFNQPKIQVDIQWNIGRKT